KLNQPVGEPHLFITADGALVPAAHNAMRVVSRRTSARRTVTEMLPGPFDSSCQYAINDPGLRGGPG
ncbi:MAG: hypothetical protein J2P54_26065, partial [Bradyrhizobiaceae bacterium]|nr:hypothetical protein [Bradyrhizobiaceae bacterium]